MTLNCVVTFMKHLVSLVVTFMKHLTSGVSLTFLSKILMWNKITFRLSSSLNLPELVINEITKSDSNNIYDISLSIRFITA